MSINKGKIGNALESVAPDHVVAVANDIFDETLNKYQSELNQQIGQGGQGTVKGAKVGSGTTINPDANGIVTLPNYTENATPHVPPTETEVKTALGTSTTHGGAFLRKDGSWQIPTNTEYGEATTTNAGLMSASDKTKLNSIETGAQVHIPPTLSEVKTALGTGNGTVKYLREDGTWQTPGFTSVEDYFNVEATSETTSVTDLLPPTGEARKVYRVGKWNGTLYDESVYSEYGWNGTGYALLNIKSNQDYLKLKYTKVLAIEEPTALSGWNPMERPVEGLVHIKSSGPIMIAQSGNVNNTRFIFKAGSNIDGIYVFLDRPYSTYNNTEQSDGFSATIKSVDIEDVFGGDCEHSYCTNWQEGYFAGGEYHAGGGGDWQYCALSVVVGKTYIVPYSNTTSVQSIVNLDANGNFISENMPGDSSAIVFNTFAVIKAISPKIGITYYFKSWNLGPSISASGLLKLPYLCLSDSKVISPYGEFMKDPFKNVNMSMDFHMTEITSWNNGYFNKFTQALETSVYGSWRYAIIDVQAGAWYLVNTVIDDSMYIADVDSGNNMSENTSVHKSYYGLTSGGGTSWALVKPKYNKLCISFLDANNKTKYQYPKYCKLERDKNNGLVYLFLQAMESSSPELAIDFEVVKEWNGGYFSANSGALETTIYGNWRYAVVTVEAGETYLIETCLFKNIRIFDMDGQGNVSTNKSIPSTLYKDNGKVALAFVKPKYNRLGFSFQDPVQMNDYNNYPYPRYAKVSGQLNLYGALCDIINSQNKEFIVRKSGGGDYTSLTKAIMDNFGRWNVTIHVDEGEYDLLEELEAYYGTSDFLSLTPKGRGIELGFDITIKASPKAIIKANYLGSDYNYKSRFSPFNCYTEANTGGFNLIGVNIQASMVRYCVHDDPGGNKIGTYNNLYENCNFYLDNRGNAWNSPQCIGGGLGHSGSIVIRNCIFEGFADNVPSSNIGSVSYHNCSGSGAKSFISCIGNYIKGGAGFRFSWYGQSQEITDILVEGNNVGHATIVRAETTDGNSPYENISVNEWNNVIRN